MVAFIRYFFFIGIVFSSFYVFSQNVEFKTRNFLRTVFYVPCLLSPIIVAGVFGDIFQYRGIVNEILARIGLERCV